MSPAEVVEREHQRLVQQLQRQPTPSRWILPVLRERRVLLTDVDIRRMFAPAPAKASYRAQDVVLLILAAATIILLIVIL